MTADTIIAEISEDVIIAEISEDVYDVQIDGDVVIGLGSEGFYNKYQVNTLLDKKLDIPTQAEWDNFTLTIQGQENA